MRAADAGVRAPRSVFSMRGLAARAAASSLPVKRARALLEPHDRDAELIAKIAGLADWPASAGLSGGSSPFFVTVLAAGELTERLRPVSIERTGTLIMGSAGLRASYHLRARARLVDGP